MTDTTGTAVGTVRPATRHRGRPRREGTEDRIVEAVLRLMQRGMGLSAMPMEAVAGQAGISKATLYRRWPGKEALLLHVLERLQAEVEEETVLTGVPLREALFRVLESIRRDYLGENSGTNLAVLAAEIRTLPELNEAFLRTVIGPRRQALYDLLAAAQRHGEIRPDLDPALIGELIVGPVLSRSLLHPDAPRPDAEFSRQVVDSVLDGIVPASP
ncbi:TetR/AcrR family transcriptional regulator [Streptomyces sp. CoH27]|uniref:TetR/AcrR family transcriptional regulator n=1 Tax=Streptomyces sp. CoH27 TaxID=2875763 RepID=UPI001CD5B030|nr:TetR/AcrR family transcriptional regulator [Streptomyces sp. CoH27]